jgi:hypothetical protein
MPLRFINQTIITPFERRILPLRPPYDVFCLSDERGSPYYLSGR